jgi:hypothetical protein
MIESRRRLGEDVQGLLEALRGHCQGRYACLLEPSGILFEAADERTPAALRAFLDQRRAELFRIPAAMASGEVMDDVFEGWPEDEFLLAFVNGRVAAVVACPDAEQSRGTVFDLLKALADRLLRYEPRWRLDAQGRGLFLGRPRLDVVAVGAAG